MSIRRFIGRLKSKGVSSSEQGNRGKEPEVDTGEVDLSDPTMWTQVFDNDFHICKNVAENSFGGFCKFRGSWNGPIKAYKVCSRIPVVKQIIDNTGWQRFFTIDTEKSSQKITEALVERWWDTTHTFHFPCGELGFTPLDWAMLTGISIGIGDQPPCLDEAYPFQIVQSRFFPEITEEDWKSQGIRCSFLKKYFHSSMIEQAITDNNIAARVARAFFIYFLGDFLFANGASLIRCGWLAALEDLTKVGTYDWGGQAVALLYMSLDACSRQKVKSFNGPWQVLQYWAYEYTHCCVPITVNTGNVANDVQAADKRPRITRWNKSEIDTCRTDQVRYNVSIARYQLEMRTPASIIWQPYLGSSHEVENDVTYANIMSRHRVILQHWNQGVWYLGDRCYRQLTGIIAIPRQPPVVMKRIPPNDICPPIDATQLVQSVTQRIYDKYWSKVSIGPIMKKVSHAANIDFIGPASVTDPTAQLPFPAPPFWAPSEYVTQPIQEERVDYGDCIVEIPLFSGGTVRRSCPREPVYVEPRGTKSYEELYQENALLSNTEAQLRRLILTDMVLRSSIPTQVDNRRRSISGERPSQSARGGRGWNYDYSNYHFGSSNPSQEYVPESENEYSE